MVLRNFLPQLCIANMKLRILTTQNNSQSAKLLADTLTNLLGYKVYRSESINSFAIHVQYGDPRTKDWQYKWMKDRNLPGPEFTFDNKIVSKWLAEGHTVFARQQINGQDGGGILVIEGKTKSTIPAAKVYTKYFKSTKEFRVMLFQDKVLQVFEKRRKNGFPKNILKTTGNGYILCSSDVVEPDGIRELAQKFCYMNRSDVKGIDIAYDVNNTPMVLEVNSAPELGPKMATNLAKTIIKTYPEELTV